jgi:hypothetical protein
LCITVGAVISEDLNYTSFLAASASRPSKSSNLVRFQHGPSGMRPHGTAPSPEPTGWRRPGLTLPALAPVVKSVDTADLKSVLSSPFHFCYRAKWPMVTTVCGRRRNSFAAWLGGQGPTRRQ